MGYNKIPLALKFNDDTGNAEGLIEFQLNVSDIGDICEDGYNPSPGDVLTYDSVLDCWTASATPAVAAGALSALTDVCTEVTSVTSNQALVWNGSYWCPSTIPTGGGGGSLPTATNEGDILLADAPGVVYSASAPSDAGIMQLDPYFDANDEGAVAQWDGTKLEVVFPDQLYMLVQAGENLSKGDVVYVSGDTGSGRFIVAKADASNSSKMPAVGLTPAAISSGNNGKIVSFGRATGLNTAGMTVGKPVYVATTPGGITKDKPTGATDLIQNIGIVSVVDGTNGVIKVTGVGRSNDIPNDLDVVGSVTVGDTVISQTNAILSNADQNSVMITDGASAVSSLSGASGSMVYFDGGTPAPILRTFDNIVSHEGYTIQPGETYLQNVGPDNLNSAITSNQIPYASNGTTFGGITTTTNGRAFMATDANLSDLTDYNGTTAENHILQRNASNQWQTVTVNTALTNASERVEDHAIGDLNNVQKSGTTENDLLQLRSGTWTPVSFQEASEGTGGDGFLADNGVLNTFHTSGGDPLVRLDASSASAALTEAYTFTIPSGTLGDYKDVEIDYYGRHLNNAGTGGNLRVAFIMGGVGIFNSQTSQGTGSNPTRWHLKIKLASMTGNKYHVFLNWTQGAQSFATSGQGNIGSMHREGVMHSEATLTSTVDNDIRFDIRHESFASVTEKYFTIDSVRAVALPAVAGAE